MYDFSGHVVMVTGAAGNLGVAVAQALHSAGATLALVDRGQGRLGALFPALADSPDHLLADSVDITDQNAVANLVGQILGRFGRIDALINTVGGFRAGRPVHDTPLETWDFMFNLNVRGILVPSRAVAAAMLERKSGKIVNISSRAGLAGSVNSGAYSAAKSAVLRLTESMAAELKDFGINVNCVIPGTIDTSPNRRDMPQADFGRWVSPAAVADVMLFLASDAARSVHGAAIPVYGRS